MKKKTLSMVMGLILGVTTVFGSIGTTAVTVSAASAGIAHGIVIEHCRKEAAGWTI